MTEPTLETPATEPSDKDYRVSGTVGAEGDAPAQTDIVEAVEATEETQAEEASEETEAATPAEGEDSAPEAA